MSKLTDSFRTIGVINNYDFAGKGNPFIAYSPADRGAMAAKWIVYRPGFLTCSDGPWYDYGNKCFHVWSRNVKSVKLENAKTWAGARYGIKEWARTPYGAWMDAGFVKRRVAELKQQVKAAQS